jgi:hypothetical protein
MSRDIPPLVMEEATDPEELARALAQRQRADRNVAWLQAHVQEMYSQYRGRFICVAGEELFVADTPEEAFALATAAHPDDDGRFLRYIPRRKVARISIVLRASRQAGRWLHTRRHHRQGWKACRGDERQR